MKKGSAIDFITLQWYKAKRQRSFFPESIGMNECSCIIASTVLNYFRSEQEAVPSVFGRTSIVLNKQLKMKERQCKCELSENILRRSHQRASDRSRLYVKF